MNGRWKVVISLETYSRKTAYNLFYDNRSDAETARDLILTRATEDQKNKPNDPEKELLRVDHRYGALDFKPGHVETVAIWDGEIARDDDFENNAKERNDVAEKSGKIIGSVVAEVLAAQKNESAS